MGSFTLGEFCAGTGAFSLAFENTKKVKTVFANDFDKNSKIIYDYNFSTKLNNNDIHKLDEKKDIPKMDIITAGFPCQPFSIAGNQEGFNDERSNVFWKLINIIKYHKPRIVIFENVKNLKTHDNGNTFKIITDEITKVNYKYKYEILNTCDITATPQNRERVYIICFKNDKDYEKFNFPISIKEKDKKKICELIQKEVDNKYYYTDKLKVWNEIKTNVKKNIKTNTIYQYRRYYVRENKNNVCPTLTANMGSGGHNVPLIKDDKGIRKITPQECFNIQGFPSTYKLPDTISDAGLYKLAGNAVSYTVVEKIAQIIVNILVGENNDIEV